MENEIKTQLIAEVARIIGLPIIPLAPTAVHDSKPFPHLVQHNNGRLFLEGKLFDPVDNPAHFLLVEAWLERNGIQFGTSFSSSGQHYYQIDDGMNWFAAGKRPFAGCQALIHKYGDGRLLALFDTREMVR